MAASNWRIRHAKYENKKVINKMSEDLVISQSSWAKEEIELLNKIVDKNPNALIIKYESYKDNLDVLVNEIEKYLNIKIPQELINDAKEYTDYAKCKKISDDLVDVNISDEEQFDIYDTDETSIHARHIYTGNQGTWKEFVEEEDWDVFQNSMLKGLKRYNYD